MGRGGGGHRPGQGGRWPSCWTSLSFFGYDKLHVSHKDLLSFEKIRASQTLLPAATTSPRRTSPSPPPRRWLLLKQFSSWFYKYIKAPKRGTRQWIFSCRKWCHPAPCLPPSVFPSSEHTDPRGLLPSGSCSAASLPGQAMVWLPSAPGEHLGGFQLLTNTGQATGTLDPFLGTWAAFLRAGEQRTCWWGVVRIFSWRRPCLIVAQRVAAVGPLPMAPGVPLLPASWVTTEERTWRFTLGFLPRWVLEKGATKSWVDRAPEWKGDPTH